MTNPSREPTWNEFLSRDTFPDRQHIREGLLRMYVRKCRRYIPTTAGGKIRSTHDISLVRCIDLARIELPERWQGKGIFSRFLTSIIVEPPATFDALYVESILDPRFFENLLRRGFHEMPEGSAPRICPSVYRRLHV